MRERTARVREEIGDSPLFAGASEEALDRLCEAANCHDYPANNILAYQGDPATTVCLVLHGRVKLALQNNEGREVILRVVRSGDAVGVIPALDESEHPANVITASACRLARFDAGVFRAWVERDTHLQRYALEFLVTELRRAYQKLGEHALMGVKERLLSTLLEIAEHEGEPDDAGDTVSFTRPTHRELAYRIGSSREVVTRYLKEILESDLLQQEEGRIIRVPQSALVLREEQGP